MSKNNPSMLRRSNYPLLSFYLSMTRAGQLALDPCHNSTHFHWKQTKMQKINLAFLILATFCIAKCLSKPTFRDHEFEDGATFRDVLKQVSDDTVMAAKSKTAVLQFLGESTVNAALEGIDIGVDFARNIDVEDRINKTEQAILDAKLAKIESK